jgi:PAS domain S-box-containing protein
VATEAELLRRIAELEAELRARRDAAETTATILDLVMRQIPGTYWLVDRDLRIVRTGGAVQQVLGYSRDRYVGMTMDEAVAVDPASGDAVAAHQRALAGELVKAEPEYRGKLLAMAIGPYHDSNGEIVGAIGTSIDVTAWRALERRMVDAQRAESLGVLAGGLAHDFNNLLVAVLGNADLALRELGKDVRARADIENIRDAALRAAELTEQLLAYAGRRGTGTTRVEPAGIADELLRILAPSIPEHVKVSAEIPPGLALRGDPGQLRQVLLNLIHNARDALAGRGGTLAGRARSEHLTGAPQPDDVLTPSAGAYVLLEVEDDGPGMDSETRRHVFEPFYTTKQTGHGLGLPAVLGIVRAHGGGIRVISSPGAGATFQILWPAAATAPMRAASQPPIAGRTVLVIDDENLVRDVVARMVEDLGYVALAAADGPSALALIDRQPVDAVLVDLSMPGMSGADVLAALRTRRPGLPVILCSGFDREGRGPIGADAYLAKPFRIDALEHTLAKLLPLRSV